MLIIKIKGSENQYHKINRPKKLFDNIQKRHLYFDGKSHMISVRIT